MADGMGIHTEGSFPALSATDDLTRPPFGFDTADA